MELTAPPRNPRSVPHLSWMYCDIALAGFSALAGLSNARLASPVSSHPRSRCPRFVRSWKVFEFFNDNLGRLLQRSLRMVVVVQIDMDLLIGRSRDA